MKQGQTVIANSNFSFRNEGARGRSVQVKQGQKFWIVSSICTHSQGIVSICREGKGGIGQGYNFTVDQFNTLFSMN